ncbi:MAG: hypothetical protein EBY16_04770, partial [Gammaproteobacteria bacterium]|nr:hypothetical protein [Gammaproteobacteria bacterium]
LSILVICLWGKSIMPKNQFFIHHSSLIAAARKLNYPVEEAGMCRGFAMTQIESILTANTKKFLERTIKIVQDLDDLLLRKEALKGKETEEATQVRLELLDVHAFFDSLCLYQNYILSSKILNESILINDLEKISTIASSDAMLNPDKYDGLKTTPIWQYGRFKIETIEPLLIELQQQIQGSDYQQPLPFLLDLISASGIGHSICITYNPLDSTWQSIDANHFPPIAPEKNIKRALAHMPFKHYEAFSIRLILPKKTFPQELVDKILEIKTNSNTIYCLYLAVSDLNLAAVTSLLTTGINPNTSIRNDLKVLHIAAYYGHHQIVEQLLTWGAESHSQNKNGHTALHVATKFKHHHVVRQLLQSGAQVNIQNKDGFTALHFAAKSGVQYVIDQLIKSGAAVNTQNKDGHTALHFAAAFMHHRVVKQLLQSGAQVNIQNKVTYTALHIAVKHMDYGHQAHHLGLKFKHYRVLKLLLRWGAKVNTQNKHGNTALHFAAESGDQDVIDQLIKAGAEVNTQNKDGHTALHIALSHQHDGVIGKLLAYGANTNIQNKDRYTVLHIALSNGYYQLVSQLLECGAKTTIQNKDGYTALHIATHFGVHQIIPQLLQYTMDANAKSNDGNTALHIAAYMGCHEIIRQLLHFGADTNAKNNAGQQALYLAACKESIDVVKALLEASNLDKTQAFYAKPKFLHDLLSTVITHAKIDEYISHYQRANKPSEYIKITPLEIDLMAGDAHLKLTSSFSL